MPGVVARPDSPSGLHDYFEPQPNWLMVAIKIAGIAVSAAGAYVQCASSQLCVQVTRDLIATFTGRGRQVVAVDTGPNVETVSFTVAEYDNDGDGDIDYVIDTQLEGGVDHLHDSDDSISEFRADVVNEAAAQHAWLLAHQR